MRSCFSAFAFCFLEDLAAGAGVGAGAVESFILRAATLSDSWAGKSGRGVDGRSGEEGADLENGDLKRLKEREAERERPAISIGASTSMTGCCLEVEPERVNWTVASICGRREI